MKKLIFALLTFSVSLFAQVPQGFNYQAALRDASGAVLSNQPISLKVEISQASTTYTEVHNVTTNAVGLVNVTIGYTPATGSPAFSAINWNAGGVSMTTSYDPAGGVNWTVVGTSALQSVPFALSAANGFSGDFNDLVNVPSLDTSSTNELQMLSATGDTIKLTQGGSVYFQRFSGAFADLTGVPPMDTSNVNELQVLSRNGDTLKLTNGGNVVLPLSIKAEKINDLTDGFTSGTSLGLGSGALLNSALTGINNTAVGQNNLSNNVGGNNNTALGSEALKQNTSGSQNTAVGQQAMELNTGGNHNTAVGTQALKQNLAGNSNVAVGHDAMQLNSSGSENTAVGRNALKKSVSSQQNTAVGFEAMTENTTGFSNVAVGWRSLMNNTTGTQNTAVGRMALMNTKLSNNNTALGEGALHTLEITNVISNGNTALGTGALYRLKEGDRNIAIGSEAGAYYEKGADNILIGGATQYPTKTLPIWNNIAIGSGSGNGLDSNSYQNVFVGGNSGNSLRNGFANTALGFAAMQMMPKGHYNVAVGIQSMQMSNTQTSANTAVGAQSLVNVKSSENTAIGKGAQNQTTTGGGNTSVGASSLSNNTTGSHNVAMGVNSLYNNTTGFSNTSIGTYSMNSNQTGQENVAIGFSAMAGNTTGSSNTAVGLYSLYGYQGLTGSYNTALGAHVLTNTKSGQGNTGIGYWVFPNLKAGSYNIGIGNNVGSNVRGANENVLIGHESNVKDSMVTNSVAIGYQAIAKSSNAVQLGNSATVKVSTSGRFEGDGAIFSDSSSSGDNAILRLSSNTKGFIYPRLTYNERQSLNPEAGMAVFCLDCGGRGQLQLFDGYAWTGFSGSRALGLNDVGIGDTAFGGVVAYIFQQGDFGYVANEVHGIIVALTDMPNTFTWASGFSGSTQVQQLLSTISTQIGKGKLNSNTIMSLASTSLSFPAVTAAASYQFNGYDDWFLPSSGDLFAVKGALSQSGISNFVTVPVNSSNLSTAYWSSSLMSNFVGARAPMFGLGLGECGCAFFESYRVRPVRYF